MLMDETKLQENQVWDANTGSHWLFDFGDAGLNYAT